MAINEVSASMSKEVLSPLSSLGPKSTVTETYNYPLIDSATERNNYLKFMPIRYNRANRNSQATKTILANIVLPVPLSLSAGYGANWGDVDLGIAGKALSQGEGSLGPALENILAADAGGTMDALAQTDFKKVLKEVAPGAIRNMVQALGDVTGIKAIEGAQLYAGKAINPHQAVLFQGVGFRTHNFAYKFVARDADESTMIRNIINVFKFCMHPDITDDNKSGSVFEFPFEWLIKFSPGIRNYMYDFTPCVLTGFNVTYNEQGIPVFFEGTGAPVQINISLTFKEVEIMTKKKLKKEFQGQAFGLTTQDLDSPGAKIELDKRNHQKIRDNKIAQTGTTAGRE